MSRVFTKSHRKNISLACQGRVSSRKGVILSEKIKIKMSNSKKGKYIGKDNPFFGKKHTQATKDKISNTNKNNKYWLGRKHSEETIKKMRKSSLGFKHSEKTKKKMSNYWLKNKEKTNNWKGGKTKLVLYIRNSAKYRKWRKEVFERDNYICQKCKQRGCFLEAHHKLALSKLLDKYFIFFLSQAYKCKDLWKLSNGLTLCKECHKLTDTYANKARYIDIRGKKSSPTE